MHKYLDFSEWVAEESNIRISVYDREVCCQSFQYHLSSNVHLTYKVFVSVGTGFALARVVGVVEARYVRHQLASLAADSDEEEVVDVMCSKTGLVEVDGHVDKRFVGHRQYDEPVGVSSGRQSLHELFVIASERIVDRRAGVFVLGHRQFDEAVDISFGHQRSHETLAANARIGEEQNTEQC